MANIEKCPSCGAPRKSFAAVCPECGYEFSDISAAKSLENFHNELVRIDAEIETETPTSGISFGQVLLWLFFFPFMVGYLIFKMAASTQANIKGAAKKKANLIATFPIPNSRNDLIEAAMLFQSQISELNYFCIFSKQGMEDHAWNKVWLNKMNQIVKKSEMSLSDDKAALKEIKKSYQVAEETIKSNTKKQYTMIGLCAVAFVIFIVLISI